MPEYLEPGVFVEEVSYRAKSIEGVDTTTTGFIECKRMAPTDPRARYWLVAAGSASVIAAWWWLRGRANPVKPPNSGRRSTGESRRTR